MSLHKFAEQVAQHGRGDDSLLVHMTPDEVQRLQKFAEANGRTLTINPETGLPEAGFLSDLFKAVAPIALGAFLGPAGFGLSATMAGVATGGITALATGSLSRGLMAGLGAYGGAGLGESFMGAGTGAGMSEALAGSSTGTGPQVFGDVAAAPGSSGQAFNEFLKSNANPATMTTSELASTGLKAAAANPLDFAKQNLGNLAYAAAPIMAGAMVPTTTPLGTPKSDNYIRQFDFNINPETGKPDPLYGIRAMTPVKASEFGGKTLQGQRELFRQQNPNPYEMGVASLNQPPQQPARMAGGGIVALAGGGTGVPTYFVENPDVAKAYTENTYGLTPEQFAYTHYEKYGKAEMTPDAQGNVARAPTTQSAGAAYAATHGIDLQKNIDDWIVNNPFATAADVTNALSGSGLTQADVNPYLTASTNLSDAQRYALSHLDEIDGLSGLQKGVLTALARNPNMTQSEIDAAQAQYSLSDYDIQSPLIHGYQVANDQEAAAQKYIADNPDVARWISSAEGQAYLKANPQFDAKDIAYTHYQRYGEDEGRKWGVTKVVPPPPPPITITPGETQLSGAVVYDNGAYGNYGNNTGNPLTSTPGDIIRNPDGTATVVPNIPGRPYGGFPGMASVRDAYTAGGGSLGYTAKAPRTIDEFNSRFNKMTGDSVAAYDYLMGKGSGKYPVKSGVPKISENYADFVLGKKSTALKKPTTTTTTTTVTGTPGQPQTYFNEAEYLAANPDVAAELKSGKAKFTSAYQHYLMYGKAEGRPFTGDYQGYLTALALANAAGAGGGGEGPGPAGTNNSGTISGFTPAPPNDSIPVSDMGIASPGTAASAADGAAAAAASASGTAPGSDGTPGSGAKRGGLMHYAMGGGLGSLGSYSDGGRLLKGPGDGVSDSIPATIGAKRQPARLADGEFVIPARIVSELGNGSTDAGAKKLYAMMDRVQKARSKTTGKNKVAANSRADKYLPA